MTDSIPHIPVLVKESLSLFRDRNPVVFCDVTVGAGGHAEAFLTEFPSIERYDGSDRDLSALALSENRLLPFKDRVRLRHASFEEVDTLTSDGTYDGVLADLGVSSMQLNNLERGFSFQGEDHPLDMRMDTSRGMTASEVLNSLREEEIGEIFRNYGEESLWRSAAAAVVHFRKKKKILTVKDLKDATSGVFPSYRLRKKIHPLTLIFQALRIYVNQEGAQLKVLLDSAFRWLRPGGRLAVISFCSLDDRPVKWAFREAEARGLGKILTKKVIMPSYEETRMNPRSRSAKLRCFEKSFEDK
ncbi:16S rRNA (cytosine(1402)-N(4))-methyltransferase RsmH [Chlamydia trachomatis]|uniref:16S rRNA (cytosine(1402)-N(4))-methyltransferase RsmH n=1 Tax=Chlamydia trachomatis TaxID=813 RepID=UPI0001B46E89|nr:16S rRNA (cytosine(1402)-N(4))-methyltransferase RsmH [Chlamydia trachomatis]ADH17039.1 S-adenosyl-methyltransferase MraW [Chlamydia trachomatis E/150]ADH20734.1 S-adenosyl-methyltransferase MraW [Chlamydia trachomatis E/11023]AGR93686.1 16S rRNA m(4)C1402 methyltransferase [Chlamydia trachomatis RC-F/69]AGR94608.1 S-adenosyl-methyltransferase MraW [Chlamydia trachomatis RC-L2(s)/46]AGR95529.1 16S rRNA m(4)C1402 methyltransferase [Chlamydia trachomatis RC-F(s)/852]